MKESWSDLAKQLIWEINPQGNFHGTPYTFNKFDDSKFLTGEGFNAHGPGHYSADLFDTAERYKKPNISVQRGNNLIDRELLSPNYVSRHIDNYRNYPDIFNESSKQEIDRLVREINKYTDKYNNGIKAYSNQIKRLQSQLDFLNNIDQYKVIESPGNLYRVNVPNENFLWKEGRLLPEQSQYIRNLWKNRNIDFSKYLRSGIDLEHDLESIYSRKLDRIFQPMFEQMEYRNGLNDVTKRLFNRYMNELTLNEQIKFMERSGNKDKINEITKGIKGIRAKGATDGPINVTFSGKDIRMANTPLQRFVNRIPTQTLGKMASKLYNTPGVKQTIKFADRVATPLIILEGMGLNQPVGQGSDIVLPQYPENNTIYGYINNY